MTINVARQCYSLEEHASHVVGFYEQSAEFFIFLFW